MKNLSRCFAAALCALVISAPLAVGYAPPPTRATGKTPAKIPAKGTQPANSPAQNPLQVAVDARDIARVKALLMSGTPTESEITYVPLLRYSPVPNAAFQKVPGRLLHWASAQGYDGLVEWLLAHGAQANRPDSEGILALHNAALIGSKEIAALLLDHDADVNAKTPDDRTPLYCAVAEGLLSYNSRANSLYRDDPVHKNKYDITTLSATLQRRNMELIEFLLKHRADAHATDKVHFETPFSMAITARKKPLIELMLQNGANADATTKNNGMTGLFAAAFVEYDMANAAFYLSYGANPNQGLPGGWSLLDMAVSKHNKELASLLLSYGADPKQSKQQGREVFSYWADLANVAKQSPIKTSGASPRG